jgi:hypothetical protein
MAGSRAELLTSWQPGRMEVGEEGERDVEAERERERERPEIKYTI